MRDFRGRAEETSPSPTGSLPPTSSSSSLRFLPPFALRPVRAPRSLTCTLLNRKRCERLLWQLLRSVIPALLSQQHAAPGGFSGSDGGCAQRESSRRAPSGRQEPRAHQQGEHDASFMLLFTFENLAKVLSFDLRGLFLLYYIKFPSIVCQKQDFFPMHFKFFKIN